MSDAVWFCDKNKWLLETDLFLSLKWRVGVSVASRVLTFLFRLYRTDLIRIRVPHSVISAPRRLPPERTEIPKHI